MGLGAAIAALIAGGTRGYRAGEELQRRLAEATRRAAIEERETALKEQEAQSMNRLRGAQTLGAEADTASTTQQTGERQRLVTRAQSPLPGGGVQVGNLPMHTYEDLGSGKDYMDFIANRDRVAEDRYSVDQRISHPESFGGSHKPYLDPQSDAQLKLIMDMVSPLTDMEAMKPGGVQSGQAARFGFVKQIIQQYGTPQLKAIFAEPDTLNHGGGGRGNDPLGLGTGRP